MLKRFARSFVHALRGLALVWKSEFSFRFQIFAAIAVVVLMMVLGLQRWEKVVLLLFIFFVLTLEILNSVLERLLDMFAPRLHGYVGAVKDIMAGAVLIASLFALIIGITIVFPHVVSK